MNSKLLADHSSLGLSFSPQEGSGGAASLWATSNGIALWRCNWRELRIWQYQDPLIIEFSREFLEEILPEILTLQELFFLHSLDNSLDRYV